MIFAEFHDAPSGLPALQAAFEALRADLEARFGPLEAGLQCDAWIAIGEGSAKVTVDTFTAEAFQVKCADPESPVLAEVLEHLTDRIERVEPPELEPHE
jgi:hypothetical protein